MLRLHVNVAESIMHVISKGYKRRHSDYVSRRGKLFCSESRLRSVLQNIKFTNEPVLVNVA